MRAIVLALSLIGVGCAAGGSADCGSLQTQAQSAVDNNKACSQDADCVVVTAACSLAGQCGVALNSTGAAELQSISEQWNSSCQDGPSGCAHCPSPPTGAMCTAGTCKCVGGCVGDTE